MKLNVLLFVLALSLLSCSMNGRGKVQTESTARTAAPVTEQPLNAIADRVTAKLDADRRSQQPNDIMAKKLETLVIPHRTEDGLNLNYAVWRSDKLEIISLQNGAVRISTGVINLLDDNEILFMVGREIGKLKTEVAKRKLEETIRTAAPQQPLDRLDNKNLERIAEAYARQPLTDSEQLQLDDFGLNFLRKHGYKSEASVSALQKIRAMHKDSLLGSPASLDLRIRTLADKVNKKTARVKPRPVVKTKVTNRKKVTTPPDPDFAGVSMKSATFRR